jgi:hypothetical protein
LSTPVSEQRITELLASAAYSQRARMLSDARSKYEQVLRIDPKNMTANYQLAVIADDEGRFADARQYYFALLRQSPHNPDILASLGWSYLLQGRYDDCESALKDALNYAPAHQTALYNLGWLYGSRGDFEYAMALFRKAGTEAEAQRALAELQQTMPPAQLPAIEGSKNPQLAWRERPASQGISAPAPWNSDPRIVDSRDRARTSGMFSEVDAFASSSPAQANRERRTDPQSIDDRGNARAGDSIASRPWGTQTIQYEQSPRRQVDQHHAVITPGIPRPGFSGPRPVAASSTAGSSESAPGTRPVVNIPADWQRNVPGAAGPPEWSDTAILGRSESAADGPSKPRAEQTSRQDACAAAAQLGLGAGLPCPVVPIAAPTPGALPVPGRSSLSPPIPIDVGPSQTGADRAANQPLPPAIYSGGPSPTPAR